MAINIGIDNADGKYINENIFGHQGNKAYYAYCINSVYTFCWDKNTK